MTLNMMRVFDGLKEREEKLEAIRRYRMYNPMFYRTNDLLHSRRVYLLLEDFVEIAEKVLPEFDGRKALTVALVHDDAEIVTGDVELGTKMHMTKEELAALGKEEERAIDRLAARWPHKVNGFSYKQLLLHAMNKDCVEAQLVSYCDKLDAYCESVHELYAGNAVFVGCVQNYTRIMKGFSTRFPSLAPLLGREHPLISPMRDIDIESVLREGKPFTHDSLGAVGIPQYDRWKEITIRNFGPDVLTQKQE